ncbi:competence protein CoiA family protein [Oceanobacillus sp. FSL K6-2867]|uniref:competence protein CoiA n=1 Tax=Oceanobacillus sp. FSL K6-2867 TaxID=2954748 RepID=UPI0030D7C30D
MLQAKTKDGRTITLATMNHESIIKLKATGTLYYCPVCGKQVIMKVGIKTIPHFAHKSTADCPSYKGGEGVYHEQGKLMLYQWLMRHNMKVELEVFLPEIQQRPDILVTWNNRRIAIEYQCARVPDKIIKLRNEGYQSVGIIPIWIAGATLFTRYQANSFRIDQFTKQLMQQYNPQMPPVLYYFCPHTAQLAILQDIFITTSTQAIGKLHISALEKRKFTDLFHLQSFTNTELQLLWQKQKYKFRHAQGRKAYGNELTWRRWLYSKGFHLENLPSIIHLPIATQYRMKIPLWNWQSKVCLEIIDPLPMKGLFSIGECQHLLFRQQYNSNYFPLCISQTTPVQEYLRLLERLQVIQKVSKDVYKKFQPITFYHHIEEAVQGDNQLVKELFSQKSNIIRA